MSERTQMGLPQTKSDFPWMLLMILVVIVIGLISLTGTGVLFFETSGWVLPIAAGTGLAAYGVWRMYKVKESRRWRRAPGVVTAATIDTYDVADEYSGLQTYHYPRINLSYEIRGKKFGEGPVHIERQAHIAIGGR